MVSPARAISSGAVSGSSSVFKSTSSTTSSFFGTHTKGAVEIFCNVNRIKGCVKRDCRYSHVCNNHKSTGGRVCEKLHAGHSRHSVQED